MYKCHVFILEYLYRITKNQKATNWTPQKPLTDPATLETVLFGTAKQLTCVSYPFSIP